MNFAQTFQINFSDGSEGCWERGMGDRIMKPWVFKNRRKKAFSPKFLQQVFLIRTCKALSKLHVILSGIKGGCSWNYTINQVFGAVTGASVSHFPLFWVCDSLKKSSTVFGIFCTCFLVQLNSVLFNICLTDRQWWQVSHSAHLHMTLKRNSVYLWGNSRGLKSLTGTNSSGCFDRGLLLWLWEKRNVCRNSTPGKSGRWKAARCPHQDLGGLVGIAPSTGTLPGSFPELPARLLHQRGDGNTAGCPGEGTAALLLGQSQLSSFLMERKSHFRPVWPQQSSEETPSG